MEQPWLLIIDLGSDYIGNIVGNGTGAGGGVGLTVRTGSFPVIGLEWYIKENSSVFGSSIDYWIV